MLNDDFNRADGTALGTGWAEAVGDLAVVGGELMGVGAAGGTALASGTALADVRVEAEVSLLTTGGSRVNLLARASSASNAYLGSLVGNNGTFTASIRRGTVTLASARVDLPLGEAVLRFEAAGSLLRLFVNDALAVSAVDGTLKSGKIGVAGTQLVSIDDFFASVIDPQVPFGDGFNRNVDSTSLGGQWREQSGDLVVKGNQVVAKGAGNSLAIYQWAALKDVSANRR